MGEIVRENVFYIYEIVAREWEFSVARVRFTYDKSWLGVLAICWWLHQKYFGGFGLLFELNIQSRLARMDMILRTLGSARIRPFGLI